MCIIVYMSRKIPLTKGYEAVIDDEDWELVTRYKWHAVPKIFKNGKVYVRAAARIWNKTEKKYENWVVSNWIMRPPKGMVVDHINGNPLDNRRENLRVCTQSQNIFNKKASTPGITSKYRGVSWDKRRGKWKCVITKNGKQIQIGRYETEKGAAVAYNLHIEKYFTDTKVWLNRA